MALLPSTAPVGGMRNVRTPCSERPESMPTAPVSQKSMSCAAAVSEAGAEIVLP
jgi:hypothetical protein